MINIVYKEGQDVKQKEGKYIIATSEHVMYEADNFNEMVAVICGEEYLDCECAETEWHMRTHTAKRLGLFYMEAAEMDSEETDSNEINENIIIYDERIGKIPYSFTDPVIDYKIHSTSPELIRVECNESFIYSLEKNRMIAVWEKQDEDYKRISEVRNIDDELNKVIKPFKAAAVEMPLYQKL